MLKRILALTVALLIVLPAITSAKKVTKLNVAPLMKVSHKGISSADELKKLVVKFQDRIKEGFEQAGMGSCFPAFMEQIQTATIEEKIIPMGQKIPWMLFYSHKKVKVSQDVEWAGKKTFKAFAFSVSCDDCKVVEFIVPKICGNVSMFDQKNGLASCGNVSVSPTKAFVGEPIKVSVTPGKCAANYEITVSLNGKDVGFEKLPAGKTECGFTFKEGGQYTVTAKAFNADGIPAQDQCTATFVLEVPKVPPTCDLKVIPTEGYVGQTFKLDASGSSDKDGKVVKADFTLTGKESEPKSVTTEPLVWEKKITKSAVYNCSVKVTDNDGLESTNNCSVSSIKVQKRLYMVAEAGPMLAKGTYTGYVFGQIGLAYLVVPEKLDFLLTAGYAVKLSGERFKNHFLADALLNYHPSKFYIGAGIGYTGRVRTDAWKAGVAILGNIGYDVYSAFNKKGSIFAELRAPIIKGLPFKDCHEILIGFRFLF